MEIDPNNLHHAYLFVGPKAEGERYLSAVLDLIEFKDTGNPDFYQYRTESFDIESAREIADRALERPFGLKKIFLISAERFTHQAQNALLKTLEEPSQGVHFFILLNTPDLLLPTLQSRIQIIRLGEQNPSLKKSSDLAGVSQTFLMNNFVPEDFLKLSLKDRINFSKDFTDKEKSLPVFLDSLLAYLKSNNSNAETINRVFSVRRFADDPSAQPRLILEHLALVLN